MGVVYRAVDPLIEREVALKTLHNELPADVADEVRRRFLREARSAGRLSHPNIVTIFDVGQEGGAAYIAMELLEGPSLHQMLRERQPIPFHSAADIVAQVADRVRREDFAYFDYALINGRPDIHAQAARFDLTPITAHGRWRLYRISAASR